MIQRKQTVYLLLSLVALVLCTLLPVGHFEAEGMGVTKTFYNLSIMQEGTSLLNIVMTVLLALSGTITVWAIFLYKNRKLQAGVCMIVTLLLLAWYGVYAVISFVTAPEKTIFHPDFACCLPFVSIVLTLLARAGIRADERLVRAADRIR